MTSVSEPSAASQLADLGYAFNSEGKLRKLNLPNEPYKWAISENREDNEEHYFKVGDAVTQYVYHLLETEVHLKRLPVPKDEEREERRTFVFASDDFDKKDTLLIFITGSGAVRAGQWARSLIMKNSLDEGSQIPFIKKATNKGYGILVMNPNDNETKSGDDIEYSETPRKHAVYVWQHYIANAKANNILIATHSEGAFSVTAVANACTDDFKKRVKATAFMDSYLDFPTEDIASFFANISRNYVTSDLPVDTVIANPDGFSSWDDEEAVVTMVSAGTNNHMMSPYSSLESVFKFFDVMLPAKTE